MGNIVAGVILTVMFVVLAVLVVGDQLKAIVRR